MTILEEQLKESEDLLLNFERLNNRLIFGTPELPLSYEEINTLAKVHAILERKYKRLKEIAGGENGLVNMDWKCSDA